MSVSVEMMPSKSYAHRALICAGLARNRCKVICDTEAEDVQATRRCVEAMEERKERMECGESGSTLRFMLPVMGALGRKTDFVTKGRLAKRPMKPLLVQMTNHGCTIDQEKAGHFLLKGKMHGGQFVLPGNVSSQFVSGLLMALPILSEDSSIDILGELESGPYVDMTLDVMADFGIRWIRKESSQGMRYVVPGKQRYVAPKEYRVEGDWSNAAFWLCMGAIGEEPVSVLGLDPDSLQGDRRILDILESFGAEILKEKNKISVLPSELVATEVDVSDITDLAPAVALLASVASGTTRITGAKRLRMKESDRLRSTVEVLRDLGAKARENKESMSIRGSGGRKLKGGITDSHGDHRIAMMAASASVVTRKKVEIKGKNAVNKSYPEFFREMERAGLAGNLAEV